MVPNIWARVVTCRYAVAFFHRVTTTWDNAASLRCGGGAALILILYSLQRKVIFPLSNLALVRPAENLYAIYAGLEPKTFINMFPYWLTKQDITNLQIQVRSTLSRTVYRNIL